MVFQLEELISMTKNTSKTKTKRLSKGQRTHVRRMKQEAGKTETVYKAAN
jgi:hypothetical protein